MSDKETTTQTPADQQTRKSNRQKTPNTYYNNEIQDTRAETKPKKAKEAGTVTGAGTAAALKQSKLKKKNDKAKQPLAHSLLQQFQQLQSKPRGNSYSEHNNVSAPSNSAHQEAQLMEGKSNPASDAAEISSSPRMSPKSCENNPNRSFSENDDQLSNKNTGASNKTHKIHKKPKFQDEKFNDNMLLSKGLLAKKSLKLPKILTIKSRGEQIDGNLTTPQGMKTGNSKNRRSSLVMSAATGESGKQKENGTDKKKDKSDDFLKGGLLDIFLDAVTGVNNSGQEQFGDTKTSNQHPSNVQGGSQIDTQNQREGDNQLDKKQQLASYGDSTSSLKRTSSKTSVDGDGYPLRKKFKKEGRRQNKGEETPGESQTGNLTSGIIKNGTIYNYPNIRSKNDCITHVERSKDKLVLHHSSFAPMEMNRIYLKEEVSSKLDLPKLIQSITINQIINNSTNNKQSTGNINSEKLVNHSTYNSQAKNKSSNSSHKQAQQFISNTQQLSNLITTQKNPISNSNQNGTNTNNTNNSLQIPQTLTMLQNLLQQGASQSQQMNDKSTFFQYALLQLQQKSLENISQQQQQQQPPFQSSQQSTLPLQSMLEAAAQVGLLNNAKNNNFNKMRSQSYEFDSSLAQRRLSEHFKISRRYSSAEEEAEIKRKMEVEKERKQQLQQIGEVKENQERENDKQNENNDKEENEKEEDEKSNEDNQEIMNQGEMEQKDELKQSINGEEDQIMEKEEQERLEQDQQENEQEMSKDDDQHEQAIQSEDDNENEGKDKVNNQSNNLESEEISEKEENDIKEEDQHIQKNTIIEEEIMQQQQQHEIEQQRENVNDNNRECEIENEIINVDSQIKQQDEQSQQQHDGDQKNQDNTDLLKETQEESKHEISQEDKEIC